MATLWQLDMSTCSREAVPEVTAEIDNAISRLSDGSGLALFPHRAIEIVYRTPAFLHRLKLPAVLLQIGQGQVQGVIATPIKSYNVSAGVAYPNVFRGREFNRPATRSSSD